MVNPITDERLTEILEMESHIRESYAKDGVQIDEIGVFCYHRSREWPALLERLKKAESEKEALIKESFLWRDVAAKQWMKDVDNGDAAVIYRKALEDIIDLANVENEREVQIAKAALETQKYIDIRPCPEKDPTKKNGANGMHPGDRVIYTITGRHGTAGEVLQDGDVFVTFDDGSGDYVKWNHIVPEQTSAEKEIKFSIKEKTLERYRKALLHYARKENWTDKHPEIGETVIQLEGYYVPAARALFPFIDTDDESLKKAIEGLENEVK